MDFRLRGVSYAITTDDVNLALRHVPPTPVDGRHKYFVTVHEREYPIKQVLREVLRLVTGLPAPGFGAQDARRILARLGFGVSEKSPRAAERNADMPDLTTAFRSVSRVVPMPADPPRESGRPLRLLVVFETDEDGWEVASCPTLPGCHSQGRTRAEALDNIREAARGYLASLREHGIAPPSSSEFQFVEVRA